MLSLCILLENVEENAILEGQNIKQASNLSQSSASVSVNQPLTVGFKPREAMELSENIFRGCVMWTWGWSTGQRHHFPFLSPKAHCDFTWVLPLCGIYGSALKPLMLLTWKVHSCWAL